MTPLLQQLGHRVGAGGGAATAEASELIGTSGGTGFQVCTASPSPCCFPV